LTALSQLKVYPPSRHIPVQIVTLDEDRHHGLARWAFAFMHKPTTPEDLEGAFTRIKDYAAPRRKRLLLVEDDDAERKGVAELLSHADIEIAVAATGTAALSLLREHTTFLLFCLPPSIDSRGESLLFHSPPTT
jgi:CheY-like chemotaxis protein